MVWYQDSLEEVKKLFRGDSVLLDNFVFQLNHKWTFIIIFFGIVFTTAENYLNNNAITCIGDNDYIKNYCFLHGASHIPETLIKLLSPTDRCVAGDDSRATNYYIWLPFVLTLCALITKLPRMIWKKVFENGMMDKLVKDATTDKEEACEKNMSRFYKIAMKKSLQARIYNYGFAFCEILNIVAIVINRSIIDRLLKGQFLDYGHEVFTYLSYSPAGPDDKGPPNALCKVFPTEVSCSVHTGSITGDADLTNILCLLSNNIFNQFYFLILWCWWVLLLSVSCIAFVYRLTQMFIPSVTKTRLNAILTMLAVGQKNQDKVQRLNLAPSELFLFTRLVLNLKGSEVNRLIEAIPERKVVSPGNEKGMCEVEAAF